MSAVGNALGTFGESISNFVSTRILGRDREDENQHDVERQNSNSSAPDSPRTDSSAGPVIARYPPPEGGFYFTSYFKLGDNIFPSSDPETFLFGALKELNLMARGGPRLNRDGTSRTKQPVCPVRTSSTLYSPIHLHKESLKVSPVEGEDMTFEFSFTFDAKVPVYISMYNQTHGRINSLNNMTFTGMVTKRCRFREGMNQEWKMKIRLRGPPTAIWTRCNPFREFYPLAILLEAESPDDDWKPISNAGAGKSPFSSNIHKRDNVQSEATLACFVQTDEVITGVKPVKQKLISDGRIYMLHEIFGIEGQGEEPDDEEEGNTGRECVICMEAARDTAVLPCRHLCLCSECAEHLRSSSSKCPMCRAPFHSLLQIRVQDEEGDGTVAVGEAFVRNRESKAKESKDKTVSQQKSNDNDDFIDGSQGDDLCSSPSTMIMNGSVAIEMENLGRSTFGSNTDSSVEIKDQPPGTLAGSEGSPTDEEVKDQPPGTLTGSEGSPTDEEVDADKRISKASVAAAVDTSAKEESSEVADAIGTDEAHVEVTPTEKEDGSRAPAEANDDVATASQSEPSEMDSELSDEDMEVTTVDMEAVVESVEGRSGGSEMLPVGEADDDSSSASSDYVSGEIEI